MLKSASGALLVTSLFLLAGCVGSAQASAMDGQGPAAKVAREWDDRAVLVGIVGIEGTFSWAGLDWMGMGAGEGDPSDDMEQPFWSRAKDDDRIGDGRCEVWMYRYLVAARNEALVVVVDRDGALLHQEAEAPEDEDVPLGEWRVDSDEALKIAKGTNEGLRRGIQSEHFGIVQMLGRDEDDGRTKWMVAGGGGNQMGGGGGMVQIDAVTGTVVASQGGFGQA